MRTLYEHEIFPQLLHEQLRELPYFRAFLRSIEARFFRNLALPAPILDLGTGDGHFASHTFQCPVHVGLDPNLVLLRQAKHLDAHTLLVNAAGNRIPCGDGVFASVISNSVLEHIPDVDGVFQEINRVLQSGGMLVITVPNSNFTKYLSIARFFDQLGLPWAAGKYRTFFNVISRHCHPDDVQTWRRRIEDAGFMIKSEWNYFPPHCLRILEWGHYAGLPSWFSKKIFGRWVLFPDLWPGDHRYRWLLQHYRLDPISPEGAYTFFIAEKKPL